MSGKKVKLVSGNDYWDFNENPIFVGKYKGEAWKEDGSKVIGYNFVDLDGEEYLISNSYSIEKALHTEVGGILVIDLDKNLEIIFRGKAVMKKNGQTFNKFDVSLLDGDDEEIMKPVKKKRPDKMTKEESEDTDKVPY
jgi:hypothetical protein